MPDHAPAHRAVADRRRPILELDAARPVFEQSGLPQVPFRLRLMPGDCLLVEAAEPVRASAFADLCSGLLPLADGAVRFLGIDWTGIGHAQAAALRGRIGRIHGRGAWTMVGSGAERDILLPRLHHTRTSEQRLAENALDLAKRFGLPGLPVGPAPRLSDTDLARAACVRAFLGDPTLLLLENPLTTSHAILLSPLIRSLTEARERGASAICLTRERTVWRPFLPFVTGHVRLNDRGLARIGIG